MGSDNCINKTYTYPRKGDSGMIDIQIVMKMFRCGFKSIGGIKVERVLDHSKGADESLEEAREIASEVIPDNSSIEYLISDGSYVVIRSSGAEPRLDVYISAVGDSEVSASETEKRIREDLESKIYMDNRMGYCCE